MKKLNLFLFVFILGLSGTMFGRNLNISFFAGNGGTITGAVKVNDIIVGLGTAAPYSLYSVDIPVNEGDIVKYEVFSDQHLFELGYHEDPWGLYNNLMFWFNFQGYPVDYTAKLIYGSFVVNEDYEENVIFATTPYFTDAPFYMPQ